MITHELCFDVTCPTNRPRLCNCVLCQLQILPVLRSCDSFLNLHISTSTSINYNPIMGNCFFRLNFGYHSCPPNLRVCEECEDDYVNSQWVGCCWKCRIRGPECIPKAAKRGDAVCLQSLIETGAVIRNNKRQSVYQSALEYAVVKGNTACAKILVEAGADVKGSNSSLRPLIKAVKGGHGKCVEFLLGEGADVNISERSGCTALDSGARSRHKACLKVLMKPEADVNSIRKNGKTALMEAAKSGNKSCILLLLNGGADVHVSNIYGDTAITYAYCCRS